MSSLSFPKIIFEDSSILVIDKPSGIVVNKSKTTGSNTVQNLLEEKYDFRPSQGEEFFGRAGIVHRLDKDTSGVLVIAKDAESFNFIKDQFKQKLVEKEYTAIVLGEVKDKKFEVTAPILRDPVHRLKMCIDEEGREAFTAFELVKVSEKSDVKISKVLARPKTGRMHQIRVHLQALNNPIMCDPIYMTRQQFRLSNTVFNRLMLHAHRVKFIHPSTKKEVFFESNVPQSFNI